MEDGSELANQRTLKHLWVYVMLIWCQVHYVWNQLKTQAAQPTWGIFLIEPFEVETNTLNLKHVWGFFGSFFLFVFWVFFCFFCFLHSSWSVHQTCYWDIHLFTWIRNYYFWILAQTSEDQQLSRTSQGQWNQIGTPETSSSLNWTTTRCLAFLFWDSHCWTIRTTACTSLSYISDILSLYLLCSFREAGLYSVLKSKM